MFLLGGKLLQRQLTPLQKLSDVSEVFCLQTPIFANQLFHPLFLLFFIRKILKMETIKSVWCRHPPTPVKTVYS